MPNPEAITQTPDSVTDKENFKSKLNFVKHSFKNELFKQSQTEPRKPLQSKDTNRVTPTDHKSLSNKSNSEPQQLKTKLKLPLQIVDAIEEKEKKISKIEHGVKRPPNAISDDRATKKCSVKVKVIWRYGEGKADVTRIARSLEINNVPDSISTPLELFKWLETEKLLSPKVLRFFSKYEKIESVMMKPSYGEKITEVGLSKPGPFPSQGCTKPFFDGFANLKALDLSCVPICDEEIRYIIKLDNLQALGLSATRVSNRAIKYLTKYANFVKTLQCLKLCFIDKIDDAIIPELRKFTSLCELDLYGSNRMTFDGCLDLLNDDQKITLTLNKVRIPDRAFSTLREKYRQFEQLQNMNMGVVTDLDTVSKLSDNEIKVQLKLYRSIYPDVYLNLSLECLQDKLITILRMRRKVLLMWNITDVL